MAANYLYTQFDRRIQPLLAGQRGPDILVTFKRPAGGEATLICASPKPRFYIPRMALSIGLNVVRSFAAF